MLYRAGPIPKELGALAELELLKVDDNKLTGEGPFRRDAAFVSAYKSRDGTPLSSLLNSPCMQLVVAGGEVSKGTDIFLMWGEEFCRHASKSGARFCYTSEVRMGFY